MATTSSATSTLEIISLNCQGLRSADHRATFFSWLNCCKVDFLCLQETHSTSEQEFAAWLQSAKADGLLTVDYECLSSPGTNRSCGVAILYRSTFQITACSRDQVGRLSCAQFSSSDTDPFQLCNIYGPNAPKAGESFFQSLYSVLDSNVLLILCSEFNTVVDSARDRRGCNPSSPWSYPWSRTLIDLMSTYDLHDIWRRFYPHQSSFTWHRPNHQQDSRLDMFWISTFFLPMVLSTDIFPFFRCDHSYIYLKLALPRLCIVNS